MTVSYTGDVATGSTFGCFWKILYRWRGSVYKLIWRELVAYLILYFIINIIYRFGLDPDQKVTFEKVKVYCRKNIESIPMSFVLGFYVTLIVKRWWDQYWILPMPDSLALYISAGIQGQDERGRLLRRTIMRYTMLSYIITLQRISIRVKKRFPTMQHLVETGLMTESEMKIYEKMDQKAKVLKFWMPVVWASNLVNRARHEGRIQSDQMVQTILTELSDFRRKLGRIMVFDNVSVPLVYTQVVTLAVYTYFVAALIGRQWVTPSEKQQIYIYPGYNLDLVFPIFLSLQFIFYIGWLKVAETLINPFGEDDDDFELNWLIDRHIKVSYMVVDEMHEEHPELLKDQYWEQVVPQDLPYNIASERYRRTEPQGSTASLKVNPSESVYADLSSVKRHGNIPDDVYAEYECVAESPLAEGRKSWLQRQLSRVESFRSTSSASSLFGRNRPSSGVNGGIGLGYHGNRPSLYERLMNRRSTKHARHSTRGLQRHSGNSLGVPEKGFLPNSRPRVPTPDVSKDSHMLPQVQITVASPPLGSKFIRKLPYIQDETLQSSGANPGYGSPVPPPTTPVYLKKNELASEMNPDSNQTQHILDADSALHENNTSDSVNEGKGDGSPTPPPPYEQSHTANNAMILSTIAENDASPYSTSSTALTMSHSSSAYPTTSSIFGRKPSPPPLIELPPIPTVTISSAHSSANNSLKSSHSSLARSNIPENAVLGHEEIAEIILGRVNEGYETDENDDGRRYMTIDEVGECKAELAKSLHIQSLPQLPVIKTKETQRNPSDDLVPLPISVTEFSTSANQRNPSRRASTSVIHQDINRPPKVTTGTKRTVRRTSAPTFQSTSSSIPDRFKSDRLPSCLISPHTVIKDVEEDDGYHEKVSYSDEDNENSGDCQLTRTIATVVSGADAQHSNIGSVSVSEGYLDVPSYHQDGGTLKSTASDGDASRLSLRSFDLNPPPPTRQKPIRRRKNDSTTPKSKDESENKEAEGAPEKTEKPPNDSELFV